MQPGKVAAQCSHATLGAYKRVLKRDPCAGRRKNPSGCGQQDCVGRGTGAQNKNRHNYGKFEVVLTFHLYHSPQKLFVLLCECVVIIRFPTLLRLSEFTSTVHELCRWMALALNLVLLWL
jgi:hypothetical protein